MDNSVMNEATIKEKRAFDDGALQALETDFKQTLQELLGDQSLEKFRVEYEKLYSALTKSQENEKRLMNKCRDLHAEIVANSAKVATALKMSADDSETIDSLKSEISKTWKLLDLAHEKETRSRETIQSLKQEINNLSKLVEKGAGLTVGQEHSVNELLRLKEELTKERDGVLRANCDLKGKLNESFTKIAQLEQKHAAAEEKAQELERDVQERNNEIQRMERKKNKMERELKQARGDLDSKKGEVKTLRTHLQQAQNDLYAQEKVVKEEKVVSEQTLKEAEVITQRCEKARAELDQQISITDALASENQIRAAQLKHLEDELHVLRTESQKLGKQNETIHRKLRQADDQKAEVIAERDTLRNQLTGLERELDASARQSAADNRQIQDLTRERDTLNKHMKKAANTTQKQLDLVKLHEQSTRSLEQEIVNYKEEAQKQRKIIFQLEKERDRYINEASDLTQKVLRHMEDIKVREMQIFDYKKKLAEADTRLRQQHNLYEAVRTDRNVYSKNLIESQDEITEHKRKLKVLTHMLDQLKEEIQNKEAVVVKQQLEYQRTEKEKETIKSELQAVRQQVVESKAYVEAQEAEQQKLMQVISHTDRQLLQHKKQLDQVTSERDILGTQLVRRNDELSLMFEKLKIQEAMLHKGEKQYNQRLEDMRVLKLEIRKMRRQNNILQTRSANIYDMRQEVIYIEKHLLRERAKCKALEEEMDNPVNIHRWRKMEALDPTAYELILKTHALQKRLILKTEEVVEKELAIQEKERLYLDLKNVLARQPGPEVAEQLLLYQQTLRDKTKQMKALVSELNMHECQVTDYKFQLENVAKELHDTKKKYFAFKKREQQSKEKDQAQTEMAMTSIQPQTTMKPRFTGGGFNLKSSKAIA